MLVALMKFCIYFFHVMAYQLIELRQHILTRVFEDFPHFTFMQVKKILSNAVKDENISVS